MPKNSTKYNFILFKAKNLYSKQNEVQKLFQKDLVFIMAKVFFILNTCEKNVNVCQLGMLFHEEVNVSHKWALASNNIFIDFVHFRRYILLHILLTRKNIF
jgi:hypothetical protein